MLSWVDGQDATALNLQNRGLAYGDGLFETIAVRGGRPSLLARHLERLALGCQRLAIEVDLALVRNELLQFAGLLGDGVAKLILTRGDSQRGYAPMAGALRDVSSRAALCRLIPPPTPNRACAFSLPDTPCGTTAAGGSQTPQPPRAGAGPRRMAGHRVCRGPDA